MSTKKITIVIGAGAAADFILKKFADKKNEITPENQIGMPIGEKLSSLIADKEDDIIEYFSFAFFEKLLAKSFNSKPSDLRSQLIIKSANAIHHHFFAKSASSYNLGTGNQNSFFQSVRNVIDDILLGQNGPDYSDHDEVGHKSANLIFTLHNKLLNKLIQECKPTKDLSVNSNNVKKYIADEIKKSEEFKIYFDLSDLVKYYQPFSIDELLDSIRNGKIDIQPNNSDKITDTEKLQNYRNSLVKAGKELIALFLLQAEDVRVFTDDAICWYRHLRNLVINSGKNTEEIKKRLKNLTIISFNYDRSLDYFLRKKLGLEFYNEIKDRIIYPYGRLARDDWEKEDYSDIPYGFHKKEVKTAKQKHDFFEKVRGLGNGLRVIGELSNHREENLLKKDEEDLLSYGIRLSKIGKKFTSDTDKKIIKDLGLICEAMQGTDKNRKFYFLGFGFHEENCRIINLGEIKVGPRCKHLIHYTNFDDSKKIEEVLNNTLSYPDTDHFKNGYRSKFPSTKKGVYDALLYDFDLSFS